MMYKGFVYFIVLVLPLAAQEAGDRQTGCVVPGPPDHGSYITNVPDSKPGDFLPYLVLNLTCNPNYEREGLESIYCFNGWWPETSIGTCVLSNAIQGGGTDTDRISASQGKCVLPPYPKHGTYVTNQATARPGDSFDYISINITCHKGYVISGNESVLCYDGWWAEKIPRCDPSPLANSTINDENSCILPPYPDHASYTVNNIPDATPGEAHNIVALNLTCQAGYVLSGPQLVFCYSGQWSPQQMPQCVAQCRLVPHPSVEYYCLISIDGDRFRACNEYELTGTLARPVCRPNYISSLPLVFTECKDGQWTVNLQKCSPECGTIPNTPLILNATVAKHGEVPWHVAIYRKVTEPYDLICGGSLISSYVVLSAAHCFWDSLVGTLPASNYIVAVGKFYRAQDSKMDKPQWSNVEAIRVPFRFKGGATNFQDDIAVVQLSTAVKYDNYIRPICVDFNSNFENRQLQLGNKGKVAGWGLTSEQGNGNPAQELRVIELPYVPIQKCFDTVPLTFLSSITSDKICAGFNNEGTALCRGDSGGGLAFLELDRGTPRYYLRGIASTAPTNENACNGNTFTTFTQLNKHETFIARFLLD